MSRIGKKPVAIPAGVEVKYENGVVAVKGPKGELTQAVDEKLVHVAIEDGSVVVSIRRKRDRLTAFTEHSYTTW